MKRDPLDYSVLALPFLQEVLSPPERIGVAAWALKYRVLPRKNQAIGGPWKHRAAYLTEIMDAISTQGVEFVSIMKSPQTGGSEALLNALAWSMTTCPGPTAYVMPTEDAKKEFIRDRIRPMLVASTHPLLRRWVNPKLWEKSRIDMPDMTLFALHAGSATDLASRPIRFVYLDEVDKYKPIPKEGHPEDLAIARTTTFAKGGRRTVVRVSTPTIEKGRIYQAWLNGDQRRWHVQCEECGTWQHLSRDSLRWPKGSGRSQVLEKKLAWVECSQSSCRARYDDAGRDRLVAGGKWVAQDCAIDDDGTIVGEQESNHRSYHIHALMSPFVSIHEIAQKDIDATGNPEKRHNVSNNIWGEPFFAAEEEVDGEDLEARAKESDFARGVAPEWAELVVLGCDVQKGPRIPWLALACGENEQYAVLDWGEAAGIEAWEDIEEMMRTREWAVDGGRVLPTRLLAIDHEGGLYTDIVEDFASRNLDLVRLVSGQARLKSGNALHKGMVDRHGKRGSKFRGLPLFSLDTNYQKDRTTRMLRTTPGQRGALMLPSNPDQVLLRHLTSEQKVLPRTGKNPVPTWQKRHGVRTNDYWDCLVYAMSLTMMLGLNSRALEKARERKRETQARESRAEETDREERKQGSSGGYWGRARQRGGGSYMRGRR